MELSSATYRMIYERLWDEFYSKEWPRETVLKRYSQSIWQLKSGNKYVVMEKVMKYSGYADERYLYRRYNELNTKGATFIKVNDMVLCGALEYLGYRVADHVKDKNHLQVKTNHLVQQFLEKYKTVDIVAAGDTRSRDTESEEPSLGKKEKATEVDSETATVTTSASNGLAENIVRVITDFLLNIGSGEYTEAWKLLTPALQGRSPWRGDATRFAEGFANTVSIKDIVVFDTLQRSDTIFDALVCFDDDVEAYTNADLGSVRLMTVGDLPDFVRRVQSLQEKIQNNGGSGFEDIELNRLFDNTASEYIWYRCRVRPESVAKIFPVRRTVSTKRLYACTCKLTNGTWLINGLRMLYSNVQKD